MTTYNEPPEPVFQMQIRLTQHFLSRNTFKPEFAFEKTAISLWNYRTQTLFAIL